MFQDYYKVYTVYTISFYIVPTLLTNAIYVAVLVKIRISSRKIVNNACISNKGNSTRSNLEQDSCLQEQSKANRNIINVQPLNKTDTNSVATTNETPGVYATANKGKTPTTQLFALRTVFANQQCSCSYIDRKGQETKMIEVDEDKSHQPNTVSGRQYQTSLHRSTVNSHTKAVSTIGSYFNIF